MAKRTTKKTDDRRDGKTYETIGVEIIGKRDTATVKIVEHIATTSSDYGQSELLRVTWKGDKYSLFVRHGSGNHRRMVKRFGDSPKKWVGEAIDLQTKTFEAQDGRIVPYVAII